MSSILAPATADRHRLLPDVADRMAKAAGGTVRKADEAELRAEFGAVVARVRHRAGLSLKEFSARIHRDERQVARWERATERPHLDAVFAVVEFQPLLVAAIAELASVGVDVQTIVTIRGRIA